MRALPRTISARTVSIDHVSTRRMNFTIRWTDLTTDEIQDSLYILLLISENRPVLVPEQ